MPSSNFFNSKNFLTIFCLGLLAGLMVFSFSLWQTPKYKSTVKLLAVFNQTNTDTYTATNNANYITGILGEVIYSDTFINSVYQNEPNLVDQLGVGSEQRQNNWNKIVKDQILDNKGVMIIDVFGEDANQTNLLASTIGTSLVNQHGLYDGSPTSVTIKMLDTPSIYENWSRNKIATDTALGLLAGLLLGFTLVIVFPNHRLFERKKIIKVFNNPADTNITNSSASVNNANTSQTPPTAQVTGANQSDFTTSHPWLDKYYRENLPNKKND